ncbi:related to quinate transport protein [Ceraceosorus bombacis]|uniref:Related to quinate transport protein n=1 Tax=Ceraceosorus bombacis TaxID=401625 RepID=A0A0P1BGW5_9BASI|nr:related to quinate transport protein [Ceraceosorus bombacis]
MLQVDKHRNAYTCGLLAGLYGLLFGWDTGMIGGLLDSASFQHSFALPSGSQSLANFKGNIVSTLQAGCFLGAASALLLPDRIGRRKSLILAALVALAGTAVQTCCAVGAQHPEQALVQLYVGRSIGGFGVGLASSVVPTYIAEIAPKESRGQLSCSFQLFVVTGMMIAFFVNYGLSLRFGAASQDPTEWRVAFGLQALPALLALLGTLSPYCPESPRWLVQHGSQDLARDSLRRLHKSSEDVYVADLLAEISCDLQGSADPGLKAACREMLTDRMTLYRCLVPAIVNFLQQWTGVNGVNYYSPQIFRTLGLRGRSTGLFATGIYGVVKVTTTFLFMCLAIEQLGRKWCLIIGGLIQCFCLWWIGTFLAIAGEDPARHKGIAYLTIAMLYLFVIGFGLGWSGPVWTVSSEVPPQRLRALAMSLGTMSNWLFNACVARATPNMLASVSDAAAL